MEFAIWTTLDMHNFLRTKSDSGELDDAFVEKNFNIQKWRNEDLKVILNGFSITQKSQLLDFKDDRTRYVVAIENNELMGIFTVLWFKQNEPKPGAPPHYQLTTVDVRIDHQRTGIANQLIKTLMKSKILHDQIVEYTVFTTMGEDYLEGTFKSENLPFKAVTEDFSWIRVSGNLTENGYYNDMGEKVSMAEFIQGLKGYHRE